MKATCGAKTRGGKACSHEAGWGTQHVGTGKCKLHGGNAGRPIVHGAYSRYAAIKRPRIKELLDAFEADDNPLDLLPEVKLLRALILDFVERYDEQTEALIAWYASFNPSHSAAFELWQAARDRWQVLYADWQKAFDDYRENVEQVQSHYRHGWPEPPEVPPFPDPPEPPDPTKFAGKPHTVLDILNAGKFIVQIGTLVERIEKQKSEGSVTLADLDQVLKQFGFELYQGVNETVTDEALRSAILIAVERRWGGITLPESKRRV